MKGIELQVSHSLNTNFKNLQQQDSVELFDLDSLNDPSVRSLTFSADINAKYKNSKKLIAHFFSTETANRSRDTALRQKTISSEIPSV